LQWPLEQQQGHHLSWQSPILLSNVREVQFPGLRALAWVGSISYSLYLIHNPLQSLVIRLALHLGQPEVVAALLLLLVPILAAVGYFHTLESWSLELMQRATERLQGGGGAQIRLATGVLPDDVGRSTGATP
jgi:peptidoglycan/LPS O-acetylase OafA/YrhL